MEEEDSTWLIELESALLDGCTPQEINTITKGKKIPESLRPDVWLVCLNCQDASNQLLAFDEIFDLPNQNILRDDVKKFVTKLDNDDDEKLSVISDIESIITFYCKSKSMNYSSNNGWIEILFPLLSLKLPRADTYNLFEKIQKLYIPCGCVTNGVPFHILRLVLQYHDPELCSFLDTKRITPEMYCMPWLKSLFAGTCNLEVVLFMWDLYFQRSDPFFIFFLSLIMIINAREQLLQMKDADKTTIVHKISTMPGDLDANDVSDFCSLAHYYSLKTPVSFREDVADVLFSDSGEDVTAKLYAGALCLPVAVHELIAGATADPADPDVVKFFLVDCRPAPQYRAGHLATAFHLDCDLMLQEPAAFDTAVQGLLNAQRQALAAGSAAAGDHLCFVSSGRAEEEPSAHMVVAAFLKRAVRRVSALDGGFAAIHDYFGPHMVECLEDHDPAACLVCAPAAPGAPGAPGAAEPRAARRPDLSAVRLFGKVSSAMRAKGQEVRGKLIEYIVNPAGGGGGAGAGGGEWHVSAAAGAAGARARRYRDVPAVFSITDEEEGPGAAGAEGAAPDPPAELRELLGAADVVAAFACREVLADGNMHDAHLAVTRAALLVLRHAGGGRARVVSRRPLATVVKITAKKRHPELITFKYGVPAGDELLVRDMDRFLIPDAAAATRLVSSQIVQQLDKTQ